MNKENIVRDESSNAVVFSDSSAYQQRLNQINEANQRIKIESRNITLISRINILEDKMKKIELILTPSQKKRAGL